MWTSGAVEFGRETTPAGLDKQQLSSDHRETIAQAVPCHFRTLARIRPQDGCGSGLSPPDPTPLPRR